MYGRRWQMPRTASTVRSATPRDPCRGPYGLVAAFSTDDPEYAAGRRALAEASAMAISPLVFGEIEHRPLSSHAAFRILPDDL